MSTRRLRASHGGRNQHEDACVTKKIKSDQSQRSSTGTPGRDVRSKKGVKDEERDQKMKRDSDVDQNHVSPAASTDVQDTPRRGRRRPRGSTDNSTSLAPVEVQDKDPYVTTMEEKSKCRQTDHVNDKTVRKPVAICKRTSRAKVQVKDDKILQHPDLKCDSRLRNTQSSVVKGSVKRDSKKMSHHEELNTNEDEISHSDSMLSPPVKRRGRPRKSQPLDNSSLSGSLSPTNQKSYSNENGVNSDASDSDSKTRHHSTLNQKDNDKIHLGHSPEATDMTHRKSLRKRLSDGTSDVPQVMTSGRKRGRPRKTQSLDNPLETTSQDVSCSMDTVIGPEDEVKSPMKRKRGRPRKTPSDPVKVQPKSRHTASVGSDTSDEETLGKMKSRMTNEGRKKQQKEKTVEDKKETCVHCKEEFPSRRDLKTHMMRSHHVIWMPGKPEGVFNLSKLFRILGKLPCLKCGKETRYPQYYKFHSKWCGREEETTVCTLCGHTLKLMYMSQHMHATHAPKTPKVTPEEDVKVVVEEKESLTLTGRVRRKAATRAIDHIKKLDQGDIFQTEPDNIKKYTRVAQVIPEATLAKFREQIKTDGRATCCFEGCDASAASIIWASRHYHNCPHAPPGGGSDSFECVRCKAAFKSKSDIKEHVKKHSWKTQDYATDTDDSADSYATDSDASNSDSEYDTDLPQPNVHKQTNSHRTGSKDVSVKKKKPQGGYSTHQLSQLTQQTLANQIFPSAYSWTLAWHESLHMTIICPEWRPKAADWTLLDNAAPYLPVSELSPNFRIIQQKKTKVPTMRLPLFESVLHGDATFNVGGPIWAAAWCPVPVAVTGRQYLAVYCHRCYNDTHIVDKCLDRSKALLQIWDCGTLQKGSISEKPQLYLAVAVDCGAIWDMVWCLSGAWDPPDKEQQSGCLPRLGLLALACADGRVHILSIPQPSCHLTGSRPAGKPPIYSVKSCLDLLPTFSSDEVGRQCLCVDWSCSADCCLVAAGFADGTVALWDLCSKSPLHYASSPTAGATMKPHETFIAHSLKTTGVKFCPANHQFLGTCSHDRMMKMWDMTDLQCPLNKTMCSEMTSLAWPVYWALTYATGDDCYCFGHNAVHVIDNGYYGLNVHPMTIHNSCIWDVSNSDWANTLASVSSVGEVAGIWLPDMAYTYKRLKGFTSRRFFIFKTTVEEHTEEDDAQKGALKVVQQHAGEKSVHVCRDSENAKTTYKSRKSKGDDHRTSCAVTTEGGTSSVSRENTPGNSNVVKSKGARTDENLCNNVITHNANRTKCTLQMTKDSAVHNEDVSGTAEKPNCDDKKMSCDADNNFCLVYSDIDLTHIFDNSQERVAFAKNMPKDRLDKQPLPALHKVCWNPNHGSHLWLAAGGHAGLVRLRHITGLQTKKH